MKKQLLSVVLFSLFPVIASAQVVAAPHSLAAHESPQKFNIALLNAHHHLVKSFQGVTLTTLPMIVSETTHTGYIAKANKNHLMNGTITQGEVFTLTALRDQNIKFKGNISSLVSLKTQNIQGNMIQTPTVKVSQVREIIHLTSGHSQTIPMGKYEVKISKI